MKPNITHHILEVLQQHQTDYISGEQLSEELNISRTAIWKHISKLREQGYEIEASRKLGYKLIFTPDLIDVEKLNGIQYENITFNIHYMNKVESTQQEAKRLAEAGAPEGTVVIAEQQLNGRGRQGRKWLSPYGKGIWMSIILRPDIPLFLAPKFTILFGTVVAQALDTYLHSINVQPQFKQKLDITIKWPNDVLLNRKKVSGILLESYAEEQKVKYLIAGIGININVTREEFPTELSLIATSLRQEADEWMNRTDIVAEVLSQLDKCIHFHLTDSFDHILSCWRSYAFDTLGALTKIKSGDRQFEAFPLKIDENCVLTVRHLDGTEEKLISADIGEVNYAITTALY